MNSAHVPIPFELHRLRHWSGQLLRAADFRDALAIRAQFRWWHNRAQHDSYGIASGLEVSLVDTQAGEPQVRVECGVAHDGFGRELIVCEPRLLARPEELGSGQSAVLVLAAADSHSTGRPPMDDVLCAYESRSRLPCIGSELAWHGAPPRDPCEGVPIARLARNDGETWSLESIRLPARSASRARIGRGATVPGGTVWNDWSVVVPFSDRGHQWLGVQVVVDTTSAGFTRTPCYFAHLTGSPYTTMLEANRVTAANVSGLPVYIDHVTGESPAEFICRVLVPFTRATRGVQNALRRLFRMSVGVCWLGIEHPPGSAGDCEHAP